MNVVGTVIIDINGPWYSQHILLFSPYFQVGSVQLRVVYLWYGTIPQFVTTDNSLKKPWLIDLNQFYLFIYYLLFIIISFVSVWLIQT
jgi:hypothetical protein